MKEANRLLTGFQQRQLRVSEVFDLEKLAFDFALTDLFGGHYPLSVDDIRFYYHPETALLEPVIHRNGHLKKLEINGLLGVARQIGKRAGGDSRQEWLELRSWQEAVFDDPVFYSAYIQALERISERAFLEEFSERHRNELQI